jgi:Flp pilus assembly pilin Flp
MSDLILHAAIRSRAQLHAVGQRLADYAGRAAERFRREQTGQDMVEYAGVLLVVSVIIALIAVSGAWSALDKGITNLVNDVLSGKKGGG